MEEIKVKVKRKPGRKPNQPKVVIPISKEQEEKKKEAQRELAKRELARRHLLDFTKFRFPSYKINWHHKILSDALERVENGTLKRLIVNMPPRHGKSELVSVNFPAWCMGRDKNRSIIAASYGADLATDFGRKVRNIMDDQDYKLLFNTRLAEDAKAKGSWSTQGRGEYNAVGVGGAITGKGASIAIIDDPVKNREEADSEIVSEKIWDWYRSTLRTRLTPDGAIVIVMTRWRDNDLVGRILEEQKLSSGEKWEVITLPAIAETDDEHRKTGEALWADHYTLDNLKQIQNDVGNYEFACTPKETPILMSDWTFKNISEINPGDKIIGFKQGGKDRSELVISEVKNIFSKIDDVYDLKMESGRIVRCTKDHKWFTGRIEGSESTKNYKGRKAYNIPKIGRNLMFISDILEDNISEKERIDLNYLSSMIDGEGHIASNTCSITQSTEKNLPVLNEIRSVLKDLNIQYSEYIRKPTKDNYQETCIISIKEPRELYKRLIKFARFGKKQQAIDSLNTKTHKPIKFKDKILDINFSKRETVYALETETGNYVAWGYASSNSQYQQNPVNRETQIFKQELFRYIPLEEVKKKITNCYITIDSALSRKANSDSTGVTINWVDGDNIWYIKAYSVKVDPTQLIQLIFDLHSTYKPEAIGLEETMMTQAIDPFLTVEMAKKNIFPNVVPLKHGGVNKEVRIKGLLPRYDRGHIYHIEGLCLDLERELLRFPASKHDDVMDSLAYQVFLAKAPNTSFDIDEFSQQELSSSEKIYNDIGI